MQAGGGCALITAPRRYRHITPEEYLAGDNDGQWRHEFVDGAVYPMPESTINHSPVCNGIFSSLRKACDSLDADVFFVDFKLRIKTADRDRFYYPDIFVTHRGGRPDSYYATDAILTVEVLSPETERLDRGEKFESYRLLPSLMEYVLLSTDAEELDIFRRRTGWQRELHLAPGVIQIESVGISTNVSNFYRHAKQRG